MARSRRITLGNGRTVSDGTYYKMRRQAVAAGIKPADFDRLSKKTNSGYTQANVFSRAKRAAHRAKILDKPTEAWRRRMEDIADDLGPDVEIEWGSP